MASLPRSQQVLKSYFFLLHSLYSYASKHYSIAICGFIWRLLAAPFYWYHLSNGIRTLRYALICQGPRCTHNTSIKSEHLQGHLAPRTYSIICIGSESCLGSIVGLPGSHVFPPYVLLYRLRWHMENYCDCVPVLPDEHLSRESRKLTVMIRRELVAVREVSSP